MENEKPAAKTLRDCPDEVFTFEDQQAKALLSDLGLIDKFSGASLSDGPSEATSQFVSYGDHPSHYVFGFLYQGSKEAENNGYVAFCLPKSLFSSARAMDFVERVVGAQGQVATASFFSGRASEN